MSAQQEHRNLPKGETAPSHEVDIVGDAFAMMALDLTRDQNGGEDPPAFTGDVHPFAVSAPAGNPPLRMPQPASGPSAHSRQLTEADADALRTELAEAATDLARLAARHRKELADAMAELTRLQRELRAETRAAIEALGMRAEPHDASPLGADAPGSQESSPVPPRAKDRPAHPGRRLGFLRT